MSLYSTVQAMADAGCSAQQIAAVVKAAEEAREEAAREKRERDTERKRRSRHAESAESVNVTQCPSDSADPSPPSFHSSSSPPTPPLTTTTLPSTPSASGPKRVRTAYPEEFENFWNACAAWRGNSGKTEALTVWKKLSPEDRLAAMAGVPGYSAALRAKPDTTPLHVCRFLKYRRFEIYQPGQTNVLPFGHDPPKRELTHEEKMAIARDFDAKYRAGHFK